MSETNYFVKLFGINVNDKVEKKNGLSYVSWPYAWAEIKKAFPDAVYTVYENRDGWNYHTDGRTCWVKTGLTVNGIEHIEYLPIMDFKNRSIPLESVTSMDVNKAIQRSLTKAAARHGLGLYVYAGEDLPEEETKKAPEEAPQEVKPKKVKKEEHEGPTDGFNGRAAIKSWCDQYNVSFPEFTAARRAVIDKGWVSDIPSDKLNATEAMSLLDAIEQHLKVGAWAQ